MNRSPSHRFFDRARFVLFGTAAAVGLFALLPYRVLHAEDAARRLPDATIQSVEPQGIRTAVFAGGCFWGIQGVFQHVKGVRNAVSGYAGGTKETANYDAVSDGDTAHAEAVSVTYDPAEIRYDQLVQIFFSVALDPTLVNRQGPDVGTQYRSALFPTDADQEKVAGAYISQLDKAKLYPKPIATKVETGARFYPAEAYHQDYMARHPRSAYIAINDAPKLRDFQRLFPEHANSDPVLVGKPPA